MTHEQREIEHLASVGEQVQQKWQMDEALFGA